MKGLALMQKAAKANCLFLAALLIVFQFFLCTCASDGKRKTKKYTLSEFSTAPLYGMIYDFDNKPCSNASVVIDGKDGPRSDINGRFITQPLSKGEHAIIVSKEGYESVSLTFEFSRKSQVLYVRMISFGQLLKQLESAIENGDWEESRRLIERAEQIKRDDPVEQYLKAMYFNGKGSTEYAIEILNGMIDQGYHEPYVYLTLADIYQYQLKNPEKAIFCLEDFLKLKRNREAEKRLESLKSESK
jgi:tetratricopeptide (TPR) repeat protein